MAGSTRHGTGQLVAAGNSRDRPERRPPMRMMPTKAWKVYDCPCGESFVGQRTFGSHRKVCTVRKEIPFESLKKDGNRRQRLPREQTHHHCEMVDCLQTLWKGQPIPLQMDHIDGNPDNNERFNLRLICPNCHAQTATYAGRNVGHHRGTVRQKKFERYPSQKYR